MLVSSLFTHCNLIVSHVFREGDDEAIVTTIVKMMVSWFRSRLHLTKVSLGVTLVD